MRKLYIFRPNVTRAMLLFLFVAAVFLVAGCAAARGKRQEGVTGTHGPKEQGDASATMLESWQPPSFERNYSLGPGDVVEITIFQLLELNTSTTVTTRISEEGYVTLPVLGSVMARELSARELEREIARLLERDYLVDPQVSVLIKEHRSRSVLVFGAVADPGIYRISSNESRVLGLLSQAGGIKPEAGDWLYVLRRKEGMVSPRPLSAKEKAGVASRPETETIQIDLRRLLETGETRLNIVIKHGDVINVPAAEQGYFFASGAVMKPGIYPLRRQISVLQGLAVVGGFSRRANPRNVQIIRDSGTPQEERIKVNVAKLAQGKKEEDVFLQPGDLLIVSRAPLAGVADFFEHILSFGVGASYNLAQ